MIEKTFINPVTNKHWQIEIDGKTIRTCLNGGKVKEILCESNYWTQVKAGTVMMGQLRKGFIYRNPDAAFGEAKYHGYDKKHTGAMVLATSHTRDDFFLMQDANYEEEEILCHLNESGEIIEMFPMGVKRYSQDMILCPNDTLLINNEYLIQQFNNHTHELVPFANKRASLRTMLDVSGNLALWYTGKDIVVFDFDSNTEVWRETVRCMKSDDSTFAYYCVGMLSPQQSKVAYRVTKKKHVLVDLKSGEKITIVNSGFHPFFSPDDQYFSVGGKFYLTKTGEETTNPFPFSVRQGLSSVDTCVVRIRGNLMAVQQERFCSPIKLWDYSNGQLLATIEDPFVVRNMKFKFTKSNLVLRTDYGAMSIYNCAL